MNVYAVLESVMYEGDNIWMVVAKDEEEARKIVDESNPTCGYLNIELLPLSSVSSTSGIIYTNV